MSARIAIVLIAVPVLLVGGIAAVDSSLEEAGNETTVTDESFEPVGGDTTTLNQSDVDGAIYDETVTVESNGTTYESDGNYSWDGGLDGNGTISVVENSSLSNQSTATIDYGYTKTTEHQRFISGMLGDMFNTGGLMVIVVGIALILFAARVLGGA